MPPRMETVSRQTLGSRSVEPAVHVLLRVRSEGGMTVAAHASIAASNGAAMLGKIGQRIGPAFRNKLNQQIERGIKTYLFVTTREGWKGPYVTYRCPLRHVHENLDAGKKPLVPTYYVANTPKIKTWFEITGLERLPQEEMNRIFVLSSERSIMSVIASSAVLFHVGVHGSGSATPARSR